MYYRNSSGVLTRIPVGSDNHVLTLDGAVPGWEAASGGGSFSQFYLEDDDGTEVTIDNNKEIKIRFRNQPPFFLVLFSHHRMAKDHHDFS